MTLPLLAQDKANHLVYGYFIAATAFFVARWAHQPSPATTAMLATLLLASLKELSDAWANARPRAVDQAAPHGVEWRDVLATVIGGAMFCGPARWLGAWACAA